MFKKVPLAAIAAILTLLSCKDETTIYSDDLQEDVVLETSETKLQSSVSFDQSGVLDIYEENNIANRAARGADDPAGDYPLTLVAQVKPPTLYGKR